MILAPLLKLPKNVVDLGKFIVARGFKTLPKVQTIANSGHTGCKHQRGEMFWRIFCRLWLGLREQCDQICQNSTTLAKILKLSGNVLRVQLVFGKILNPHWQILYTI